MRGEDLQVGRHFAQFMIKGVLQVARLFIKKLFSRQIRTADVSDKEAVPGQHQPEVFAAERICDQD